MVWQAGGEAGCPFGEDESRAEALEPTGCEDFFDGFQSVEIEVEDGDLSAKVFVGDGECGASGFSGAAEGGDDAFDEFCFAGSKGAFECEGGVFGEGWSEAGGQALGFLCGVALEGAAQEVLPFLHGAGNLRHEESGRQALPAGSLGICCQV